MISLVSYNYVISYQRDSKFGHFIYKKQEDSLTDCPLDI